MAEIYGLTEKGREILLLRTCCVPTGLSKTEAGTLEFIEEVEQTRGGIEEVNLSYFIETYTSSRDPEKVIKSLEKKRLIKELG